ncbi:hypothetical protein [Streptomyces sp. NPDC050804]|uniref:hypothetical protein n=1 Tax=Streptomyces sp. NPDC050804 TaxID=3154745 RepID=UPI0034494891
MASEFSPSKGAEYSAFGQRLADLRHGHALRGQQHHLGSAPSRHRSQALGMLGVVADAATDEFAIVGPDRYRSGED